MVDFLLITPLSHAAKIAQMHWEQYAWACTTLSMPSTDAKNNYWNPVMPNVTVWGIYMFLQMFVLLFVPEQDNLKGSWRISTVFRIKSFGDKKRYCAKFLRPDAFPTSMTHSLALILFLSTNTPVQGRDITTFTRLSNASQCQYPDWDEDDTNNFWDWSDS